MDYSDTGGTFSWDVRSNVPALALDDEMESESCTEATAGEFACAVGSRYPRGTESAVVAVDPAGSTGDLLRMLREILPALTSSSSDLSHAYQRGNYLFGEIIDALIKELTPVRRPDMDDKLLFTVHGTDSKKKYCQLFNKIVHAHSQLNRIPKFFVKFLLALTESMKEESGGKFIANGQILPEVQESIARCMQKFPHRQMVELWKIFIETFPPLEVRSKAFMVNKS